MIYAKTTVKFWTHQQGPGNLQSYCHWVFFFLKYNQKTAV